MQSKAKIFLADERGLNTTDWFSSRNTFNFGKYQSEHKTPFGKLILLNDDELAGGRSISMLAEELLYIIIFPVAGAVRYSDNKGRNEIVAAGQSLMVYADKGLLYELLNPFSEGTVNVLHLWIRREGAAPMPETTLFTYTDVNEKPNTLLFATQESNSVPFSFSIGKFSGRGEAVYQLQQRENTLFVFVITGAYEVEGRLLHERDGLALWDTERAEMEALSNDAIILTIELPLL